MESFKNWNSLQLFSFRRYYVEKIDQAGGRDVIQLLRDLLGNLIHNCVNCSILPNINIVVAMFGIFPKNSRILIELDESVSTRGIIGIDWSLNNDQ